MRKLFILSVSIFLNMQSFWEDPEIASLRRELRHIQSLKEYNKDAREHYNQHKNDPNRPASKYFRVHTDNRHVEALDKNDPYAVHCFLNETNLSEEDHNFEREVIRLLDDGTGTCLNHGYLSGVGYPISPNSGETGWRHITIPELLDAHMKCLEKTEQSILDEIRGRTELLAHRRDARKSRGASENNRNN